MGMVVLESIRPNPKVTKLIIGILLHFSGCISLTTFTWTCFFSKVNDSHLEAIFCINNVIYPNQFFLT